MRRCVAHKGPSGAFVTYCNISCYIEKMSVVSKSAYHKHIMKYKEILEVITCYNTYRIQDDMPSAYARNKLWLNSIANKNTKFNFWNVISSFILADLPTDIASIVGKGHIVHARDKHYQGRLCSQDILHTREKLSYGKKYHSWCKIHSLTQ